MRVELDLSWVVYVVIGIIVLVTFIGGCPGGTCLK